MFGALSLSVLVENCFAEEQDVLCGRNNGKRTFNVVRQHSSNIRSTLNANLYRGADKSLARPGRKQATATEDFDFHISYL